VLTQFQTSSKILGSHKFLNHDLSVIFYLFSSTAKKFFCLTANIEELEKSSCGFKSTGELVLQLLDSFSVFFGTEISDKNVVDGSGSPHSSFLQTALRLRLLH
jgi:hypothetical protein